MNSDTQISNEVNVRIPWHCPELKILTVNLDSKTPSVSVTDFPPEIDQYI